MTGNSKEGGALTLRTHDMKNHEKIWTIESSKFWTVDLNKEVLKGLTSGLISWSYRRELESRAREA
jgi:hypothetical protein